MTMPMENLVLQPSEYARLKAEGKAAMHALDSDHVLITIKKWDPTTGIPVFQSLNQPMTIDMFNTLVTAYEQSLIDLQAMKTEAEGLMAEKVIPK